MTPQEQALQMALLKVLTGELGAAKKSADDGIRDGWRPSDRLTATLPGGTDIGTVTLAKGRSSAHVSNDLAYEEWVRAAHPEEIETITTVRVKPEFTTRLISAARQRGVAVDAETGEEVPGITVSTGDPYPMVKLAEDAREAIAQAWQAGDLTELVSGLLAIEGGEES